MAIADRAQTALAYLRCIERVREHGSTAEMRTKTPACPGWTLRDVCAHLAGNATALAADDVNPSSPRAWIDEQIDRRRSEDMSTLLTELIGSGERFACRIADEPRRWVGIVYDAIVHEHDIRAALGRPSARDDAAIELIIDFELRDLARHARELNPRPIAITSCEPSRG